MARSSGGHTSGRRLFYLAVSPPAFAPITRGIGAAELTERARVVYEKPYGTDVESFRVLDRLVTIQLGPAHMSFSYERSFESELIGAYERLIHDALIGDRTLFTRGDGIERTWEVVGDVIARPRALNGYAPGSWGPKETEDLIAPRRWHFPAAHEHR